jgi:hypothetical protein
MRFLGSRAFLCLLVLLPLGELGAHALIVSRVAPDADFRAAADFVRTQLQARDLITVAPAWADPILRLHLGDRIPLSMAGRSDNARYERMWVLSTRGALPIDAPKRAPELQRDFGRVRVLRYALGKSPVLFDFTDTLLRAHATIEERGHVRDCPLHRGGLPHGGGLGRAVLFPLAERFDCDPRRPWLVVGPVVTEDLEITPRHCIWQHAAGDDPISVTWSDVPLGSELVFYAGLYYEHERMRDHGPVRADIFIDGERRGGMVHEDGDGWKRLVIPTSPQAPGARGEVRVEVRAHEPDRRSFCWSATTRETTAERAP